MYFIATVFLAPAKKIINMPIMPKIITVTGNLLAETTSRFVIPKAGETSRAIGESIFSVGGKGVNVSRYASAIGLESVAVIFPAGFIGKRCLDYLARENFNIIPVEIAGETREGLVCLDIQTGTQTTFLGNDLAIPNDAFEKSLKRIEEIISSGDIIALCGSFPAWQDGYAEKFAELCQKSNARFCVDTYGAPLRDVAKVPTDFLKFNKKELLTFLNDNRESTFENLEDAFALAREKYFSNAKIFAITDGAGDILFSDSKINKMEKISPIKIEREVSATGCGDAFFAVAISEIFAKQTSTKIALTRAAKYASMCAQTESTLPLSGKETLIALS